MGPEKCWHGSAKIGQEACRDRWKCPVDDIMENALPILRSVGGGQKRLVLVRRETRKSGKQSLSTSLDFVTNT